jgi:hypothetical protein
MSYTITSFDGTQLVSIPDGTIDQTATNLTLVGKNATGYGQYFNENFVYLLENFAGTVAPTQPVPGQLWFNSTTSQLNVYTTQNGFISVGSAQVANSQPSVLVAGDFWINNLTEQLFFNDGTNTILAGPIYTAQQGLTGFQSLTVVDTNSISHTLLCLYVAETLIGVFNKDGAFTLASPTIAGISGQIYKGFTSSTLSGMVFNQVSSEANALVASDGSLKTAEDILLSAGNSLGIISASGSLSIANATPLILGPTANFNVEVTNSGGFTLQNNATASENFTINLETPVSIPSMFINSTTRHVGLYNANPQATLHIGTPGDSSRPGSVIIEGNLTVNGTTTSNNTATVNLEDYTITLAKTESPSDTTANGAGLIIAGTTNKSILWSNTIDSGAFTSTESIDVAAGKSFSINGSAVITATALGSSISSAPGLTSIGNLSTLTSGYITITSNTISYVNASSPNGNVTLVPKGVGAVNVSSAPIINLAMNVSPDATDAANVSFVSTQLKGIPLALTIPTSGLSDTQIGTILTKVFPNTEHVNGTVCRVLKPDGGGTVNLWTLTSGVWVDNGTI